MSAAVSGDTVDGSEIRQTHQLRLVVFPPLFTLFYTSQVVVWDFFHQQYLPIFAEYNSEATESPKIRGTSHGSGKFHESRGDVLYMYEK